MENLMVHTVMARKANKGTNSRRRYVVLEITGSVRQAVSRLFITDELAQNEMQRFYRRETQCEA